MRLSLLRWFQAIFDVLPKISAIICMFCLIIYIFGVMCTELFGTINFADRFPGNELAGTYSYFTRLDDSLFTLFIMVTLDWASVTRAVMQVYPWANVIFSLFVTFSSFVLYNLVIAVVCDSVKMVQDQQDILMVENYVKGKIESRHRIINLRQKLDKMSKQQMDLLLYVQLLLEQVEDIDEASKQHYEEALLQMSQNHESARGALTRAIHQLDEFEKAAGLISLNFQPALGKEEKKDVVKSMEIKPVTVATFVLPPRPRSSSRRSRVSFREIMIGIIPDALLPAKETDADHPDALEDTRCWSAPSQEAELNSFDASSMVHSRTDEK
jgi:Ion transport protein